MMLNAASSGFETIEAAPAVQPALGAQLERCPCCGRKNELVYDTVVLGFLAGFTNPGYVGGRL